MFDRNRIHEKSYSVLMIICLWSMLSLPEVNAAETVIYSQGFESNNGGYVHSGVLDKWEWGTPATVIGPGGAHSGSKCWGTDLDDTVPYNANMYLVSPAITLPALGTNQVMRVRFYGWIGVDFMEDRGQFQISSDGITWETKTELLLTMQGGWNEYVFDISDYADSPIYLRFRCFVDNVDNFDPPAIPYNMAGFYVDDIAITVVDAPGIKKILTFEGNENQSAIASCPWIYIEGKKKYEQENDIYSTARGASREYTDYYQLNRALPANKDGKYIIKLKETEQEESFTDLFHLLVVDHAANVDVAVDEYGTVFTYRDKKNNVEHPSIAVDNHGLNVLPLVTDADEIGCKVYHGDYVDLTFNYNGNPQHPIFLIRAQGFLVDTLPGSPINAQPKIQIQTQNSSGTWVTRNVFYPRWKSAFSGYDMAGLFPYAKKIRLVSVSCLTGKYHLIDWVAISTQNQKSVTITDLTPESAIRSDGIDVMAPISTINGTYAHMTSGEEVVLTFNVPSKANDNKRDFIIKSKGYYIPNGTYFFYTWDGTRWVQRDGWTIPTADDQTREFDLSLWLPDPSGNNRVRIWQDFFYDPAAVDYVGLRRDSVNLIMNYATDLRNSNSVLNLVNVSDNNRHLWDWGEDWGYRNRWLEIGWVDTFVNTPPSTQPAFVTNTGSPAPTINWTYFDLDGNAQEQFEIEVWSESGGVGSNLWDPLVGTGLATSVLYAGVPLAPGTQYYARVKAFDGVGWGTWSEASFTVGSNLPPVAEAGTDITVTATPSCLTSVALDGSASYDPDDDPLSFLWTGPFGTAIGPKPAVFLNPGIHLIRLLVFDGIGGTGMDSVTVTVQDIYPPLPDSASLPQISGNCGVTITTPPTATDICAGTIVGTTDSLTFTTPGIRTITWMYNDGNGNSATQTQTVVVADVLAPVPDVALLPSLSGECFVAITDFPTATDNCSGTIVGTTMNPYMYSQVGTYTVTWRYLDGNGNLAIQIQTVTVTDNTAPVPNVATLPVVQGNCYVTVSIRPTATDNCRGTIIGATTNPLSYSIKGNYTITWSYNDTNGNISQQQQTIAVIDGTPPVPDINPLPEITGYITNGKCYRVLSYPSATDNCKGKVVGTTSSPLRYCNIGDFIIVWRYNDGNGNITTQNQIIRIR